MSAGPNSEPVSTGTTIMAFKYKDGVMLAADSRTSSGSFVASRVTDKITHLTDNIYCCRSGSAADTQLLARHVTREVELQSLKDDTIPSVRKAAYLMHKYIYDYSDFLLAAIIMAGYDESGGRVFKINVCGTINEVNIAVSGSGSAFIFGYCDITYREGMTLDESIDFARTAVRLAANRDCSSGGVVRIASITAEGVKRWFVSGENVYMQ